MKIITVSPNMDIAAIPQINRFTDGVNIYIVETKADYAALPASIQTMLGPDALAALQA